MFRKVIFLLTLTNLLMSLPVMAKGLEQSLQGTWILKKFTCKGQSVDISGLDYSLSFNGKKGDYISKTKTCTQVEPEIYEYLDESTITIKQGIRQCRPQPCAADLPATECGKETNPQLPRFHVAFEKQTLVLSTDDPKSIDCTAAGQSKPAVFYLERQK
jgi:hypothetical protein